MNEEQYKREAARVIRELLNFVLDSYPHMIDNIVNERYTGDEYYEIHKLVQTANILPFWKENI